MKVHSYTRHKNDIDQYKTWCLSVDGETISDRYYEVEKCRPQGRTIVAKLSGVDSLDEAEKLVGRIIKVPSSALPELPADEYYWHQLIGLEVISAGDSLGSIDSIIETGANDVLVVKTADGEEVLVPYIPQVVIEVDIDRGHMRIDWDTEN